MLTEIKTSKHLKIKGTAYRLDHPRILKEPRVENIVRDRHRPVALRDDKEGHMQIYCAVRVERGGWSPVVAGRRLCSVNRSTKRSFHSPERSPNTGSHPLAGFSLTPHTPSLFISLANSSKYATKTASPLTAAGKRYVHGHELSRR